MNKNSIIAILAALVGLMAITLMVVSSRDGRNGGYPINPPPEPIKPEPKKENVGKIWIDNNGVTNIVTETKTISDGKTNTVVEVAPVQRALERRPLEPEATKRLHDGPVIVNSVFEASGKGEHASYGKAIRGSYLYTTTVMAQSKILDKKEDKSTGKVFVKEQRKFLQSRDALSLSDLDVAIALDTLPVDEVKTWCEGACRLVGAACAIVARCFPVTAPWSTMIGFGGKMTAEAHVAAAFAALHAIDGTSARGLLGAFGVSVPENIERFANEWLAKLIKGKVKELHNVIQSIEGKSFIITYEQEKNGAPLNVDYKNEDGSPITDAEWEILRSANAFLDTNVVPDTRCRVGDTWTVWADEVQELFGCAGHGRAEGKISIERVEDQKDGTWTLKIAPATVEFRSDDGTTAGKMQVKDGNGLVDGENASVKSLHATAEGNLRSLNKKRHLLFFDFVKRLDGDSNLRFTLTAEPAKAEPAVKQVSK